MKHFPKLPNGTTGFYNERNEWVCTGSQMGRRDTLPENRNGAIKLRMVRLRWTSGDYDEGGTYWGAPSARSPMFTWIYRAMGEMDGEEFTTEIFTRAGSRVEAKAKVRALLPMATFYR